MKEKDQESATYVHKAVRFLDDKLYFMKSDPTDAWSLLEYFFKSLDILQKLWYNKFATQTEY